MKAHVMGAHKHKDGTVWFMTGLGADCDALPDDYIVDGSAPATTSMTPGASVSTGVPIAPYGTILSGTYSVYCADCKFGLPVGVTVDNITKFVGKHQHGQPQPISPSPSERLSAIAYDKHHLPRTYPHKWVQDAAASSWRCNCPIEPMRVSAAMLEAYKG